jgi:hypothetical protein
MENGLDFFLFYGRGTLKLAVLAYFILVFHFILALFFYSSFIFHLSSFIFHLSSLIFHLSSFIFHLSSSLLFSSLLFSSLLFSSLLFSSLQESVKKLLAPLRDIYRTYLIRAFYGQQKVKSCSQLYSHQTPGQTNPPNSQ